MKLARGKKMVLMFVFGGRVEIAAIRVWNYSGHRVNNNIGVRKVQIKVDGEVVFGGEIRQSSGSSEDAHKYC